MYAVLDYNNKTVIGCYPPDIIFEKMIEDSNGRTLIFMTIENSPAWINGTYINGKFYPPKEIENE